MHTLTRWIFKGFRWLVLFKVVSVSANEYLLIRKLARAIDIISLDTGVLYYFNLNEKEKKTFSEFKNAQYASLELDPQATIFVFKIWTE